VPSVIVVVVANAVRKDTHFFQVVETQKSMRHYSF
jgi:hypothetical protein